MKNFSIASLSILFLLSTQHPAVAQSPASRPASRPAATTQPPGGSGAATSAPRPAGTTGTTTTGTGRPTNATPPRAADASVAADYRLVSGDKLRIDVYKDPNLSQSLQIRPDGKVTLPLLGDVAASGRTPSELRDAITQSLKQYITEPVVTVIVVETMPQTIYVMGEISSPGSQSVTAQMTVLQALATAGGFKDFAKTKDIRILRKTRQGGIETIRFNYNEAIKGNMSPVYVQPGDTIIVP